MKNKSSHNFSQWQYQNKALASLYQRNVGETTSIILWKDLQDGFLNFIPKEGRILEIGCGPGIQAMKILQHRHDLEIIASDFSSQMISLGKKNHQKLISQDRHISKVQSHLSFIQADAMDLSQFGSETFDGIYCVGVIKHFPDRIHGLNECIRILKPGGRMFFSEFFAEATFTEMKNFLKHVKTPGIIKPIMIRSLHHQFKKEAPSKAEISKWENDLSPKGFAFSEYLQGYPFFMLKFEKNGGLNQ